MKKKSLIISSLAFAALILSLLLFTASCGEKKGELQYSLNSDGASYSVYASGKFFDQEELVIPAQYRGLPVVAVSDRGFSGTYGYKTVNLPETLTSIGYEAFKGARDLERFYMPESVTEVESSAFAECDRLRLVSFSNSVKVLSGNVLQHCDSLETVKLPDGLTVIQSGAFSRCIGIKNLSVPASVKTIEDYAFEYCEDIVSVTFEEGSQLESIGRNAFYACTSLKEFDFPPMLKEIGTEAFYLCRGLEMVRFTGSQLESIGSSAFNRCNSLSGVDIADIGNWCGVNFISDDYSNPIYTAQKIYHNGELVLRLEIPLGVTEIKPRAFKNATRIISVTLPTGFGYKTDESGNDSLSYSTSIGTDAFRYCYKLAEIFNYSHVQITSEQKELATFGYIGAYVKKVHLFENLKYPAEGELFPYGESGKVYPYDKYMNYATRTYTYGENNEYIFFKDGKEHYLLGYFGNDEELALPEFDDSYGIFTGAFFGHLGLKRIVIPNCVTEIGHYAFYSCESLQKLFIPQSVLSVGERIVGRCDGITIYIERAEHTTGWKGNWAEATGNEVITFLYSQSADALPWIREILEK